METQINLSGGTISHSWNRQKSNILTTYSWQDCGNIGTFWSLFVGVGSSLYPTTLALYILPQDLPPEVSSGWCPVNASALKQSLTSRPEGSLL